MDWHIKRLWKLLKHGLYTTAYKSSSRPSLLVVVRTIPYICILMWNLLNCCSCGCADEIDAIGTKRYESNSSGEREIQRTMLELLNQLDGFDSMGDVKVWPPNLSSHMLAAKFVF